jgi:hypothetical protein
VYTQKLHTQVGLCHVMIVLSTVGDKNRSYIGEKPMSRLQEVAATAVSPTANQSALYSVLSDTKASTNNPTIVQHISNARVPSLYSVL